MNNRNQFWSVIECTDLQFLRVKNLAQQMERKNHKFKECTVQGVNTSVEFEVLLCTTPLDFSNTALETF